jgi:hypothetical protein
MNERGSCLIAWLILLLIVLGLGSIIYFFVGVVMVRNNADNQGFFAITLAVALSIGAAGASTLLSRRRYGFWMLAGAFAFAALLQLLGGGRYELALAGLVNIGVIWWLLRPVWNKLD